MKKAKTPKWMWLLESLLWWVPEQTHEKPMPQIWHGSQVLVIEWFYTWSTGQVIGYDIKWNPRVGYTLYYNIVTEDVLPISVEEEFVKII